MENKTDTMPKEWDELATIKNAIPEKFWENWETFWGTHFTVLFSFLEKCKENGVNSNDFVFIKILLRKLQIYNFLQVDKEALNIHPTAVHLISHYIRNSLHKFTFIFEDETEGDKPLTNEAVCKLLSCLEETKNFWAKLKEITKDK